MGLQIDVPANRTLPSGLLASIGVVLGLAAIVYVDSRPSRPWWWTIEIALAGVFPAILTYSGYWLATSDFDSRDLWRILAWTVVGLVALTTLTGLLILHQEIEGSNLVEPAFSVLLLAMGGALFGLTTAISHLRWTSNTASGADERSAFGGTRSESADAEGSAVLGTNEPNELRRRLEIIEYVAAFGELTVSELATMLSERPGSPFADDFDQVQVRLYQFDLPRVAWTDRITFDPGTEMVRYTGRPTLGGGSTETLR